MVAAMFSFLGIIIGALLQYFFTRHLDNQKHRRELKTKAYTDYLNSVCELANFGKRSPELSTKTADAKARICLYGSASAVSAFATFERLGATMNTPEQRNAFTNMVAIMRSDSGSDSQVALKDLEAVLLGVRP
ncbi:MAG TPA: hypothetical protein VK149_13630 [Sideroxyarcus sp.]|nr:hypothetical protein [Sideroxyarcus sp.]